MAQHKRRKKHRTSKQTTQEPTQVEKLSEEIAQKVNIHGEESAEILADYVAYGKALHKEALEKGEEILFVSKSKEVSEEEKQELIDEFDEHVETMWSVLELARVIAKRELANKNTDVELLYCDTLWELAEFQMEQEQFAGCLEDLFELSTFLDKFPPRFQATVLYKLSITCKYMGDESMAKDYKNQVCEKLKQIVCSTDKEKEELDLLEKDLETTEDEDAEVARLEAS